MVGEPVVMVSEADVRSLEAKLGGLRMLLTAAERVLLHAVFRRAADAGMEAPATAGGCVEAGGVEPFARLHAVVCEAKGCPVGT